MEMQYPASYYRLYELLNKYRAKYGKVKAKRVAHKIIDIMTDKSISAQVFKQLVNYTVLEHISGHEHHSAIKRILKEGYHAFRFMLMKESKIETQRIVSQVATGLRKKDCSILGEYHNHYVLTSSNGLSTLLPKNCANREYNVGHSLRVHIVHADAQHYTMFVSEKPNSDIQTVMSQPLLVLNKEIEVRFSNIDKIVPSVIKCFGRTQIQINHYSDGFDYKKKYRGKVIKRIDNFTFLAVQLYAASKRANSDGVTEKNYRERLSQVLDWDINDLQSWMKDYQESSWESLYKWCDSHFFYITKCERKSYAGKYVQYPVKQALHVFTDEDLKYIAACFVDRNLQPGEDIQERDFMKIVGSHFFLLLRVIRVLR